MTETTPAVAQEIEATDGYSVAYLNDLPLRIKSISHWRPSYLRALRGGDYDGWAEGVLHEDDVATFIDADPTFDEINEFTSAAMEAAGEAPKKSGAPARSSRSTRKR